MYIYVLDSVCIVPEKELCTDTMYIHTYIYAYAHMYEYVCICICINAAR